MTRNRHPRPSVGLVLGAVLLLGTAGAARADVTGSYDGALVGKKGESAAISAALAQGGPVITGTLAMTSNTAPLVGTYAVTGKARGAKVKLAGTNANGVTLKWSGKLNGDVAQGKANFKGAVKAKGAMSLTKRLSGPPSQPRDTCPDNPFFTGQVQGRVLKPICSSCHSAEGTAKAARFRVTPTDLKATQESVAALVDFSNWQDSPILKRPLGELPHGGGNVLQRNDEEYSILATWVQAVANATQCDTEGTVVTMVPMEASELLVRASMDTRGKRPSVGELDAIDANPNMFGSIVDQYLASPEFLDRVRDVYDDALLLRREDFIDDQRDETSAIYGEAVELIAYIVQNDRPMSEMGTADYTVANSLFQQDPTRMQYTMDRMVSGTAWEPVHYTDGRPHAGVLSTSAFYTVWDTNQVNKNRRRANRVSILFDCYNFLDTPVDVTRNVDNDDENDVLNAVTTRADCKACHDRLDPMASFLFPLDNARIDNNDALDNFFNGDPAEWRTANRRPPAIDGKAGIDLKDMGRLLVTSPKFAECQTKRAFKMLFLRDPKTTDEIHAVEDIAGKWATQDGYNFRALVRRWMSSPTYTQRPQNNDPQWVRRVSPERLELVVRDLTGYVWQRPPQDDDSAQPDRTEPIPVLTNEENGFKVILGGINGVSVTGRSFSLNASVAMVQRKVASLAADYVLRVELPKPDGTRALLNGATGAENPATDEAAIRSHIVQLSRRFYGQKLGGNDPQVTGWFSLYRALYQDRSQGGTAANQVPGTQGERAWRGLLTAMLRSPKIVLY